MSTVRQLSLSLLLLSLVVVGGSAQTQPPNHQQAPSAKTNVIIDQQLLRFTTQGDAVEWRLVITNQHGELIYDSGLVYGSALDWPLKNQQDEAVQSGLYAYTLTTKAVTDEAPRTQRGHLIVDRASSSDRVWLTSTQPVGIGADSATPQVTVSGGREATVGGAELPGSAPRREASGERGELPKRASDEAATGKTSLALSPNATANRVAKFGNDGVTPVDTQVSETNGALVVGNAGATGNLQIFGAATADVFAGMGPDVANGPALNFGYAGSSFGRSAGFFNVRPDASAVAPNPSLRFATANVQRMIITNTGNVGIGIPNPNSPSRVEIAAQDGLRISGHQPFMTLNDTSSGLRGAVASGDGNLGFYTHSFIGTVPAVLIRNNTGNVGIGTSYPSAKLQVEAGNTNGIQASSQANAIIGISTTPFYAAIYGENLTSGGIGVYGKGDNFGVIGEAVAPYASTGLYGLGRFGVFGQAVAPPSGGALTYGVFGKAIGGDILSYAGFLDGRVKITYDTVIEGEIYVVGDKHFVEPHPTDPNKMIKYVALEGPEAGTYFRGSGRITGGVATIQVPEDFRLVSDEKGLTVQVTPLGEWANIWCVKKSLDQIELKGSADVEFDFVVNGVRRLSKDHQPIVENTLFVPSSAEDNPFKHLKPEVLRRLKDTGILNEDGTVNMETVKKLDAYKRMFKQEQ